MKATILQQQAVQDAPESPAAPLPPITWRGAIWYTPGRLGYQPVAIVIHTAVGSLAGMRAHFNNPNLTPRQRASAHYGVGLSGEIDHYVREWDTAWANGVLEPGHRWPGDPFDVNAQTLSIETEDLGRPDTEPVTDAQYVSTLALCRVWLAEYPGIRWLMGHYVISPLSRSCPAARWRSTGRLEQLAQDLGLPLVV